MEFFSDFLRFLKNIVSEMKSNVKFRGHRFPLKILRKYQILTILEKKKKAEKIPRLLDFL